jgi:hypothetical protein
MEQEDQLECVKGECAGFRYAKRIFFMENLRTTQQPGGRIGAAAAVTADLVAV